MPWQIIVFMMAWENIPSWLKFTKFQFARESLESAYNFVCAHICTQTYRLCV